MINLKNI
jgi:hypothetical protein